MAVKTILVGLVTGCFAILLGLWPGLGDAMDHFRESSWPFRPRMSRPIVSPGGSWRLPGQIWFAAAGAILILLALFTYLLT